MQKRRLLHGSISDNIYELTDKENVRVEDFLFSVEKLAKEYLRGAVELETSGTSSGITDIAVGIVAQIIKLMLEHIPHSKMLKIRITADSDLKITLEAGELPPTKELAKIITFAKSAGFTVSRDDVSITLSSKITTTQLISIYAISRDRIYEEMRDVFNS